MIDFRKSEIPSYIARQWWEASASQKWWDARRFGLSPGKWRARLTNEDEPKIACITVPKAGTHLLERALCLSPRLYRKLLPTLHPGNVDRFGGLPALLGKLQSGQILVTHLPFTEERQRALRQHGVKTLFMVRDPRDVAVSRAFYIDGQERHPYHAAFDGVHDVRSKILISIEGNPAVNLISMGELLANFEEWISDDALLVRFEDLIGGRGGGSDATQTQTLRRIFDFIGVGGREHEIRRIKEQLFSDKSPTFRKGTTGGWVEHFDEEIKDRFKAVAGDALVQYGYEEDTQW